MNRLALTRILRGVLASTLALSAASCGCPPAAENVIVQVDDAGTEVESARGSFGAGVTPTDMLPPLGATLSEDECKRACWTFGSPLYDEPHQCRPAPSTVGGRPLCAESPHPVSGDLRLREVERSGDLVEGRPSRHRR